jgi:hypothetical protein|tara:strand:+ start:183 stop:1154 length:972 start_codon:yes stop_codon:yes gene_type:complete
VNRIFPYIVLAAALSLAGTAAYYSVFGLSKLFSAQATAVIIMASILEASKLITASYLHRQWKSISILLKTYLITAMFILMCITSLGIYGFLVSAYQETAYELETQDAKISVLELKKSRYQTQVVDIRSEKESLNKNITELTTGLSNNVIQYTNAEGQVITTTSSATRRTLEKQLQQTTDRRDTLYSNEIAYSDSVSNLDLQMLKLQTESKVSAEVGPIKYVAQRLSQPVDTVVNWFILLFIFVFDPLAVMLLIASNKLFQPIQPKVIKLTGDDVEESKAKRVKAPTQPPPPIQTDIAVVDNTNEDIYEEQPKPNRVILKSEIL